MNLCPFARKTQFCRDKFEFGLSYFPELTIMQYIKYTVVVLSVAGF